MRNRDFGGASLRIVTGLSLLAFSFALIWVPALDLVFMVYVAVLAVLGLREYFSLAGEKGAKPEYIGATAGVVAMVVSARFLGAEALPALYIAGFIGIASLHVLRGAHSLRCLAISAMGLLYTGWFPASFVLIHHIPGQGPALITWLILVVAASDSAAYFVGSAIGRHKLAPVLSPKKSWEGAVAGMVGAALAAVIFPVVLAYLDVPLLASVSPMYQAAMGAALSVFSQFGDLCASMLKRDAGAKDSGTIFPGHGGVLDRCDGFLFAGPVLYYGFLEWL